jgi:hypothetical protein
MMRIHVADQDPHLKKFRIDEYDRLESSASDPDLLHPGLGPNFLFFFKGGKYHREHAAILIMKFPGFFLRGMYLDSDPDPQIQVKYRRKTIDLSKKI